MKAKKKEKGFSNLDLLAIFVILGTLAMVFVSEMNHSCNVPNSLKCSKMLKDIFQACVAYANTSSLEGGGDNEFPFDSSAGDNPALHFQLLVNGGFLTEPCQFKCPASSGPSAQMRAISTRKPWATKDAPFDLTINTNTCYYAYNKGVALGTMASPGAIPADTSDPKIPLAADRWSRTGGTGKENNHKRGRNVLMSTGSVNWVLDGGNGGSGTDFSKYASQLTKE